MFPRSLEPCHKENKQNHTVFLFTTGISNEEVADKLMKMGVAKFLAQDSEVNLQAGESGYSDKRIITVHRYFQQGCCSFTKNASTWMLIPIRRAELENTGYTEDNLIYWLKFLNGMNVGFKYMYLGKQHVDKETARLAKEHRIVDDEYYWVAVPNSPRSSTNVPYLHWICLRYMINTTTDTSMIVGKHLSYYHIPRVAVMLHKDYKLTKFRAFLYAHIAGPIYYYYAMFPSNQFGAGSSLPDVSVSALEFKKIWPSTLATSMNNMLTPHNPNVKGIKQMTAPYDYKACFSLFNAGEYEGFIKHIKNSYKPIKVKTKKSRISNVKKEVAG